MIKLKEGDKVRVISDGRIFTVDWRAFYNDFTGTRIFVQELDGVWFFRENLEKI